MPGERKKKDRTNRNPKIVTVRIPGATMRGQEPCFLFTASQVEEVLRKAKIQPLPFAEEWLLGLCAWRHLLLPVVHTTRLYGINSSIDTDETETARYIIIRFMKVDEEKKEKKMFRCILKVPDQIASGEIPEKCVSVTADQAGISASLVRGIFEYENGLMIIPDLVPVTCPDSESDTV